MNEHCREDEAIVIKGDSYNVSDLFTKTNENMNAIYNNKKILIIAETLGSVEFLDSREWQVSQDNVNNRIKIKMYGICLKSSYTHFHLGADDWTNHLCKGMINTKEHRL